MRPVCATLGVAPGIRRHLASAHSHNPRGGKQHSDGHAACCWFARRAADRRTCRLAGQQQHPWRPRLPVPLERAELAYLHAAGPALLGGGPPAHLARHHQLQGGARAAGRQHLGWACQVAGTSQHPLPAGPKDVCSGSKQAAVVEQSHGGQGGKGSGQAFRNSAAVEVRQAKAPTCVAGSQCSPRFSNSSSRTSSPPRPATPTPFAVVRTYLRQHGWAASVRRLSHKTEAQGMPTPWQEAVQQPGGCADCAPVVRLNASNLARHLLLPAGLLLPWRTCQPLRVLNTAGCHCMPFALPKPT